MLKELIQSNLREIPDFPSNGILYKDITPLIENTEIFNEIIESMYESILPLMPSKIVGIESRGFIFSAPLALRLGIPLVLARKPGKLPYKTISASYKLEYGTDSLEMHIDSIQEDDKVVIVDDILATGGTANAACELVKILKGEIVGLAFLITLSGLNGKRTLSPNKIISLFED